MHVKGQNRVRIIRDLKLDKIGIKDIKVAVNNNPIKIISVVASLQNPNFPSILTEHIPLPHNK